MGLALGDGLGAGGDDAKADVTLIHASASSKIDKVELPVTFDQERSYALIRIPNLEPEHVYRATVRISTAEGTVLADIGEFFVVTSGDTPLSHARHQVVTTALRELSFWESGRVWDGPSRYGPCPGGWCGMFPWFCARRNLRIFGEHPADSYARWGQYIQGGGGLADFLSRRHAVHADHGWWGAHKMLVVAYDRDTGILHTIEGNVGQRVMRMQRLPHELTAYGALEPDMVLPANERE